MPTAYTRAGSSSSTVRTIAPATSAAFKAGGSDPVFLQRQRRRVDHPVTLVADTDDERTVSFVRRRILEDRRQKSDGFIADHVQIGQFGALGVDIAKFSVVEIEKMFRHIPV